MPSKKMAAAYESLKEKTKETFEEWKKIQAEIILLENEKQNEIKMSSYILNDKIIEIILKIKLANKMEEVILANFIQEYSNCATWNIPFESFPILQELSCWYDVTSYWWRDEEEY
jgi:hypothetical protein